MKKETEKSQHSSRPYVCDLCGYRFSHTQLDEHFMKISQEAAQLLGFIWSGKLVTFDESGKAWCPRCFKDAESVRHGGRTVHEGERRPYLMPPNIGIAYTCKCGEYRSFNCRSVNIFTGLETICATCGAVLFVPPTIFDHSTYWPQGEGASLRPDFRDQMKFL